MRIFLGFYLLVGVDFRSIFGFVWRFRNLRFSLGFVIRFVFGLGIFLGVFDSLLEVVRVDRFLF